MPELRIVDDELWQRVKLRQAELATQFGSTIEGVRKARAERLNRLRRPAFLLSGLLTCGCCGGKYGIIVNDRYGCLGHFRRGTCNNGPTIRRDDIERRVLAGLTDKLVSPEAAAVAVRAYAEETNRQNHERRAQVEADRRSLEKINRGVKGILDAIEDGMYQPAMKARMSELEQQKAEIEKRLEDAPADLPDVHPNIAEHYRAKVIRLAETLAEPEANVETREDIRSLIGEVVITPGEKRGESHAVRRGELMAVLDLAVGRRRTPRPEVITKELAGPRFEPTTRQDPEALGGRPEKISQICVVWGKTVTISRYHLSASEVDHAEHAWGDEGLKPLDRAVRLGDRASVQAATRVNAEQASKKPMCRSTRHRLLIANQVTSSCPILCAVQKSSRFSAARFRRPAGASGIRSAG